MKAKEFDIKKRDPNWRAMQDIRRSGAGGQHKDKKKAAKQGEVKHKGQMAEGVDIGKEWMSDTELDQYVPDRLQDEWRELVGYDIEGKAHPLWANMTGGYEPDVNDPQDRANMVKVANKWFAMKKIPNVKFYDVKDADDELEWLVQIGEQGVSEGQKVDEPYMDKVISSLHKDALGVRPDHEFGREWMSSSFEEKQKIYYNLLSLLDSDMDEGIGGMIAGGVGQFIGNKIDPLAGEIMRAHGEIAGRKAEYTIRKYMHLLQKALKQQLDSGGKNDESMREASDFGEPREILEDVLRTLEREVEWPLTDVMDPREVKQLLAPLVKAVNDKMMSMEEGRRDYGYDSFGNSLRPGDDEGSTEPPNNFAIYINGKKWKVFQGKGQYADDQYEMQQFRQLQSMAARKSQETGKKWEVVRTGEPATR